MTDQQHTPPFGYMPRELSGRERDIESLVLSDDVRAICREVKAWASELATAMHLDRGSLTRICDEVQHLARLCMKRGYSPFAVVDEIYHYLSSKRLIAA